MSMTSVGFFWPPPLLSPPCSPYKNGLVLCLALQEGGCCLLLLAAASLSPPHCCPSSNNGRGMAMLHAGLGLGRKWPGLLLCTEYMHTGTSTCEMFRTVYSVLRTSTYPCSPSKATPAGSGARDLHGVASRGGKQHLLTCCTLHHL